MPKSSTAGRPSACAAPASSTAAEIERWSIPGSEQIGSRPSMPERTNSGSTMSDACRRVSRMRWGERLEYVAEAGPGDFIFVPPYVPHQEINASPDAPLSCVLVRSGQEPVVVNLELDDVEADPEHVRWVDDLHA